MIMLLSPTMIINDNPSLARLYISFLHEEGTTRKQGCTQFLKEFNMPAFLPSFSVSKLTSSGSNPTKLTKNWSGKKLFGFSSRSQVIMLTWNLISLSASRFGRSEWTLSKYLLHPFAIALPLLCQVSTAVPEWMIYLGE